MSKNMRFCYKVDKSVGLEKDENGNNKEAYVSVKQSDVESYNMPKKQYKRIQEGFKEMLSACIGCNINKIIPITLNEYLDNTEERIE